MFVYWRYKTTNKYTALLGGRMILLTSVLLVHLLDEGGLIFGRQLAQESDQFVAQIHDPLLREQVLVRLMLLGLLDVGQRIEVQKFVRLGQSIYVCDVDVLCSLRLQIVLEDGYGGLLHGATAFAHLGMDVVDEKIDL